jgi:anti-anti-sigma regulatory factor
MLALAHTPRLQIHVNDEAALVRFPERRLDEHAFPKYGDALGRISEALPGRLVTLDLGDVVALSCGWLGAFITLGQELRATGGKLRIRNVHGLVYEVFLLTRLTDVLDVRVKGRAARSA